MSAPSTTLPRPAMPVRPERLTAAIERLRSSRFPVRRATQMLLDLGALSAAFVIAYLLRYEFAIPDTELAPMLSQMPAVVALQFVVLALAGNYSFMWRYVGVLEVRVFLAATFWTATGLIALRLGLPDSMHSGRVPISIIVVDAILALALVVGLRVARRVHFEWRRAQAPEANATSEPKRPVLLVGAGRGGASALREIAGRSSVGLEVKGFVDDDPAKLGEAIQGVRVLGTTRDIPQLAHELGIDHVIVTISRPSRRAIRRIAAICDTASIRLRTTPALSDIAHGHINASRIRDVELEHVLGHEAVLVDEGALRGLFEGRTVMVTGAGGSVGSALARQIARYAPSRLLLVERAEAGLFEIHRELTALAPSVAAEMVVADVGDAERVASVFARHRPSVVFHAAAHKDVATLEQCPREAVRNNLLAAQATARLAGEHGVERFVFVSTSEAARPKSVMAASKRLAEAAVLDLGRRFRTRYVCVRFESVAEAPESIVTRVREQIRRGGPVRVSRTADARDLMTLGEAAKLLLAAAGLASGGELFMLTSPKPVGAVEVAESIIRHSGLRPHEDIEVEIEIEGDAGAETENHTAAAMAATAHPNISAVTAPEFSASEVRAALRRLDALARSTDEVELRRSLIDLAAGGRLPATSDDHFRAAGAGLPRT